MREIRLYGRLAKFIGQRILKADVATAAEAVRFLLVNFPQLEKHMADQNYRVKVGNYAIDQNELSDPAGNGSISFVPVIGGAGTVGRIIAGVVLIAVASLVTFGTVGGLFLAGSLNSAVFGIGASLVLGGVATLLTPVPKIAGPGVSPMASARADSDPGDPKKNYNFSGIQNTSRQGSPIPIVYGECLVGSVVISAAIDIDQVAS
jgi:predicted phage tail protein